MDTIIIIIFADEETEARESRAPHIYIHTYEHGFHKQGQVQKASWQDNT